MAEWKIVPKLHRQMKIGIELYHLKWQKIEEKEAGDGPCQFMLDFTLRTNLFLKWVIPGLFFFILSFQYSWQ